VVEEKCAKTLFTLMNALLLFIESAVPAKLYAPCAELVMVMKQYLHIASLAGISKPLNHMGICLLIV
jgi:hypothetical protein